MSEARAAPRASKWPARKPLQALKARHHTIARLLVQGRKVIEIARETGYSRTYVSRIQADPVMQELLADFARQRDEAFAYALRREMEIVIGLGGLCERLARQRPRRRRRAAPVSTPMR
jgi:DNA-binding NarL/FixJ family response regulator